MAENNVSSKTEVKILTPIGTVHPRFWGQTTAWNYERRMLDAVCPKRVKIGQNANITRKKKSRLQTSIFLGLREPQLTLRNKIVLLQQTFKQYSYYRRIGLIGVMVKDRNVSCVTVIFPVYGVNKYYQVPGRRIGFKIIIYVSDRRPYIINGTVF